MPGLTEPLSVTARVGEQLDAVGVPWVAVGALAAFLHGVPRTVPEVQLVVRMSRDQVEPVAAALRGRCFVDGRRLLDAVMDRSGCPVDDLSTGVRVELLMARDEPLARALLDRRVKFRVYQTEAILSVLSAEDTVLAALDEFKRTRRQDKEAWADAVGVLRATGSVLDLLYLQRQARVVKTARELDEALAEARRR